MAHRIFGGVMFLWMGAATIYAVKTMANEHGTMFYMHLGIVAFCVSVSILGLLMAVGKNEPTDTKPD